MNQTIKVPEAQMKAFLASKPEALHPVYRQLRVEGERNRVLNCMHLGLNAMQLGYWNDAKDAFDHALNNIESVYADNKQAAQSRSLWYEEGRKNFKGEPYERVMAYYYRGLIYIRDKDFQNARACFKAGINQDVFAEEKKYQADFALMSYLGGWVSLQLNDDYLTKDYFEELKKFRPDVILPKPEDNVLIIVETGKAPRKLGDGVGHWQLKLFRGKNFKDKRAAVSVDGGEKISVYPLEDIYWQATTRGGRQIDHFLKGQAIFKAKTEMVGSTLTDVAATTMHASTVFGNSSSQLQGVGAAVGLLGVAAQLASYNARPEADIRYWANLPDSVHTISLNLTPGTHQLHVEFQDEHGINIEALNQKIEINVPETSSNLIWLRSMQQIYIKK
ncbi:hypothetical protein QUF90_12245 [Desulfococcaceae bacterium HSG9]|nr:hypothetical protein [Desulfococcaceae bacterium HSG9]